MLAAACGEPTARVPADQLVAHVLDECHRLLRGQLDRISADVTLPGGETVHCAAQLPDRLRTASSDGVFVLVGDTAVRVRDNVRTPASATERLRLTLLRGLLDAASLGPLHRAAACRDAGADAYDLEDGANVTWRVQFAAASPRPTSLTGPLGEVRLLAWRQTTREPPTWMVTRAELAGLGVCEVSFALADVAWDADFWTTTPGPIAGRDGSPATAGTAPTTLRMPVTAGVEPRSAVPIAVTARAVRWVVLPDPGDWAARAAAYAPLHAELLRQNQQIAGFFGLTREGERDLLVVPFRQRPDGAAFTAPEDWTIRDVPAGKALVVYPPQGDLDERRRIGEAQLRDTLVAEGVAPLGPVLVQPWFHLHEGPPSAAQLAAPVVRISVLVP